MIQLTTDVSHALIELIRSNEAPIMPSRWGCGSVCNRKEPPDGLSDGSLDL